MISWDHVSMLYRDIGSDEFDGVVSLFFEEVETTLSRLRSAPQPALFEAELHFLKSSMLSLGFFEVSALCHAGESLAAKGEQAAVDLSEIVTTYKKSKRHFLIGLSRKEQVIPACTTSLR